jgi:hypothetical protein
VTGHGAKFGRKQEDAIVALLTQRNVEDAARSAGIAPKTLLRWMKQPEFDAAYRAARRDGFRQSVARLQQASSAAVTTLLKIMVDTNAPASTRVRAADSRTGAGRRADEILPMNLQKRLAALEKGLITEPTVLTMPDGSTVNITGPGNHLVRLLGTVVSGTLSPEQAAQLDLIRQATASKEPGGGLLVELIGALLSPVGEVRPD